MNTTDYLGKRISVPLPQRGHNNELTGKTVMVAGTCSYIGPNEFLGWSLQVTLDRMPIRIDDISQIQLL